MFPSPRTVLAQHRFTSLLAVSLIALLCGCSARPLPVAPGDTASNAPTGFVVVSPSPFAQTVQYQVSPFDVPASFGDFTSAFGINDVGVIVGNFAAPDGSGHGFLYQDGQFTDVTVPGSGPLDHGSLSDINNAGLAVGGYSDASDVFHTYLRGRRGGITKLPDPLPGALSTDASDINAQDAIVGTVIDGSGATHGFITAGGTTTIYDHPGAIRTRLLGLNNGGQAVGFWTDPSGLRHGFLLDGATATEIVIPGSTGTGCLGINDRGQIVGFYRDADFITHGFLLDHGALTTIDFPGSSDTRLTKINNGGVIVGTYDFFSRGMVAVPVRGADPPAMVAGGEQSRSGARRSSADRARLMARFE